MAHSSSAQREPSMEEILASIRRIIEDSDAGQKQPEPPAPMKPANDVARQTAAVAAALRPEPATEIEGFRAELHVAAEPLESAARVSLADVQAMVAADRSAARQAAERDYRGEAPEPAMAELPRIAAMADWRSDPPAETGREDEDDGIDQAMNEALQEFGEMSDHSISAASGRGHESAGDLATQRPAIVSDHAERQVAAAFGELADAFAARSKRTLESMAEELMRPMLQDWLDNNLPLLVEKLVREEIERIARGS